MLVAGSSGWRTGGIGAAVALVAAVLGALLLHVPFRRSLSVTCYGLVLFSCSGFFHGVRRPSVGEDSGMMSMFGCSFVGQAAHRLDGRALRGDLASALFVGWGCC
jgi:hypothetical protein